MIYFFKKFFKLQGYCFIGRGGMLFFDGNDEYYIDTENYVPNSKSKSKYAVTIFQKEIRYKRVVKEINENQKKILAFKVQSLLAKDNIISTIE